LTIESEGSIGTHVTGIFSEIIGKADIYSCHNYITPSMCLLQYVLLDLTLIAHLFAVETSVTMFRYCGDIDYWFPW